MWSRCPACDGYGYTRTPDGVPVTCPRCGGRGIELGEVSYGRVVAGCVIGFLGAILTLFAAGLVFGG